MAVILRFTKSVILIKHVLSHLIFIFEIFDALKDNPFPHQNVTIVEKNSNASEVSNLREDRQWE